MISVKIYKPEPYTEAGGFILANIANRLVDIATQHSESLNSVTGIISRLWALDPGVLALAALDNQGHIKGHAIGIIEGDTAYLLQPRVDEPTEGDTIGEFVALAEDWLKVYNSAVLGPGMGIVIPGLTLLARRADPKWMKKYNFSTVKYVMFKPLKEGE